MTDRNQGGDLKALFQAVRREDARIAPSFEHVCGSETLGDNEFVSQFESCRLPKDQWKHGDHLRLGWCYVRRFGSAEAEERMVRALRAYAATLGVANKYHETMTRAWLRLVAVADVVMPANASLEAVLIEHLWLLNKQRLNVFYSSERLASGRIVWTEPDLRRLPCGQWCCRRPEER